MNNKKYILGLLSITLWMAPTISMASINHFAIAWPATTVQAGKATYNPLLLYKCADTKCKILNTPTWVTVVPLQAKYGLKGKPLAPISYLNINSKTTYKVYQSNTPTITNKTKWSSCEFTLSTDGSITTTNCIGAVKTGNSSTSASAISFAGNVIFAGHQNDSPSQSALKKPYNVVPTRTVTFVNKSPYSSICLSLNSQFVTKPGQTCSSIGGIELSKKSDSYTLHVTGPTTPTSKGGGSMSGTAFIVGFKDDNNKWHYSGNYNNTGLIYATAMEWSMLPTAAINSSTPKGYTDHTIGVSTVDISAVNGYNVGAHLSIDNGAVCSAAKRDSSGKPMPATYRFYSDNFAQIPAKGKLLSDMCPTDMPFRKKVSQRVIDKSGVFLGCLSPCKYATYLGIDKTSLQKICCDGAYDNSEKCTQENVQWGKNQLKHADLPYVLNLASPNTVHVYRWQFDDYAGTFSCDPNASFTFTIV